jgi:hypothetical protein
LVVSYAKHSSWDEGGDNHLIFHVKKCAVAGEWGLCLRAWIRGNETVGIIACYDRLGDSPATGESRETPEKCRKVGPCSIGMEAGGRGRFLLLLPLS